MKMESYKLIDGLEYDLDSVGLDLYWRRFQYRATVRLPCVGRARYYKTVERFKEDLDDPAFKYVRNYSVGKMIDTLEGEIEDLCKFIGWRNKLGVDTKILIRSDSFCLYYNDPAVLRSFIDLDFVYPLIPKCTYRVVYPSYDRGVVYLQNPKHNYRIYLNTKSLDMSEVKVLRKLVKDYRLRPCPTVERTLSFFEQRTVKKYMYFWNSNFIDATNESDAMVLALHFPNLISAICKIEKRSVINTP